MARIIRTSDGDRLDTLCHQEYGHLNGSVEAVIDANRSLAAEPQPYRAGVIIFLPDLKLPVKKPLRLWS
jgi:phage tail protein X